MSTALLAGFHERLKTEFLIPFRLLPIPLWSAASRYVAVYDEEYSDLKIWALQASNAVICVANLPMKLPLSTSIGATADALRSQNVGNASPLMSTYTQNLSAPIASSHNEDEQEFGAARYDILEQLRLSCPLPPLHSLHFSDDAATIFVLYYRESADYIVTNTNKFLAAVANTSMAIHTEGTLTEKAAVLRRRAASKMEAEESRLEALRRLEGSKRLDVFLQLLDLERLLRSQSAAAIAERGSSGTSTYSAAAAPIVFSHNAGGFAAAAMAVTAVDFTRVFCGDELRIESSASLPWGAIERASQEKVDLFTKRFLVPIDDVPSAKDLLVAPNGGDADTRQGTGGSLGEEEVAEALTAVAPIPQEKTIGTWGGFLQPQDSPLAVSVLHIAIVGNTVVLFLSTGVVFAVHHTGETSMHDVSHWRPETISENQEDNNTQVDSDAAASNFTTPCVWLRCPRPPLPPFLISLLLREEGCYAYFSATNGEINKDALLRNEINHGGASTAVTLCQLNHWSAAEIQETTLQLAVSESAEAVYHVVSQAFKDDCRKRRALKRQSSIEPPSPVRAFSTSAIGGFSLSDSSPTSPKAAPGSPTARQPASPHAKPSVTTGKKEEGTIANVEKLLTGLVYSAEIERPTDTLHLLTRLCNTVCVRLDNCPDEPAARRALNNLISTCISMLAVVGRYCAEFSDDTVLAYRTYPNEASKLADQSEDSYLSKLVRESAPLSLPFLPPDEAKRRWIFEQNDILGGLNISRDRQTLFAELAYHPLLASEDTYMLLALRQGMLEMRASVKEHAAIYGIASDTINWSSKPKGMIALSTLGTTAHKALKLQQPFFGLHVTTPLGSGADGKVYKAIYLETNIAFAVKEMPRTTKNKKISDDQVAALRKQINSLRLLPVHANVVHHYSSMATVGDIYIKMQYIRGRSISRIIGEGGSFDEATVRHFSKQICEGLVFLHANGVIHRDIKGANVIIDDEGVAKIADFGCSIISEKKAVVSALKGGHPDLKASASPLRPATADLATSVSNGRLGSSSFISSPTGGSSSNQTINVPNDASMQLNATTASTNSSSARRVLPADVNQIAGTPLWMAPEVMDFESPIISSKCDVWSFACTVVEMATGKAPWYGFKATDPWPTIFRISQCGHGPQLPPKLSRQGHDFLERCFNINPEERMTAAECLKHPFLATKFIPNSTDEDMQPPLLASTKASPNLNDNEQHYSD